MKSKKAKLCDYLKFDSTLNRETAIELRGTGALGNTEIIKVQEGVTLRKFAPERTKTYDQNKEE